MFKFVKIQRNDLPDRHISWMCLIDTLKAAEDYTILRSKKMAGHYINVKDKLLKTGREFHNTDFIEDAIELVLGAKAEKAKREGKTRTLVDDCNYLDTLAGTAMRLFLATGSVLVNYNGGCFSPNWLKKEVTILETVNKRGFIFPTELYTKKDIRIIQWKGGKHYYAKICAHDVIIDGEQKWNTYKQAESAAKKYLRTLKRKNK
jgi:hypothetical protein